MSAYFVILLTPRMLNSPGCCYAKTPKRQNTQTSVTYKINDKVIKVKKDDDKIF